MSANPTSSSLCHKSDRRENDDGNEDSITADDGEEGDVLLPDNTDHTYQFSATLDGIEVAIGFRLLFIAVKEKRVFFHNVDQAL